MHDQTLSEIWAELKRYINTVDRPDAADSMVSVLIDNDYSAEDIRDMFKGDSDIKRALSDYLDDRDEEEEEDLLEPEEDEDW